MLVDDEWHTVYKLSDPRNFDVRYVGMTVNIVTRYQQHLNCKENNPKKNGWVQSLVNRGIFPIMEQIDKVRGFQKAREIESYWLHYYLLYQPNGAELMTNQQIVAINLPIFATEETPSILDIHIPIEHYAHVWTLIRQLIEGLDEEECHYIQHTGTDFTASPFYFIISLEVYYEPTWAFLIDWMYKAQWWDLVKWFEAKRFVCPQADAFIIPMSATNGIH